MTESISMQPPQTTELHLDSTVERRALASEVDQVNSTEWSAWLERFADASLYQTWAYGEIRWSRQQLSHLVLKHAGEPVAMAQLRIVRPLRFGFGIAYLRWGPVCELKGKGVQPQIIAAMARALHAEYVQRRGLLLRILPQGFQGTARAAAFADAFREFRIEPFGPGDSYRTMLLDLAPPLEVVRKKFDGKWRNQLNRAEKNEFTVIEGSSEAEFSTMISLFNEMWQRKQFAISSDINEFRRIQEALPASQKLRVFICLKDGVPMSGLLGALLGDTGIYLFGGTSDEGMKHKGSYLLQWRMIQWLKENGARYYNLGGINPVTNPGVYHFKQGMSGADVLYIEPRVACTSLLSKLFVGAGLKFRGGVRRKIGGILKAAAATKASPGMKS